MTSTSNVGTKLEKLIVVETATGGAKQKVYKCINRERRSRLLQHRRGLEKKSAGASIFPGEGSWWSSKEEREKAIKPE